MINLCDDVPKIKGIFVFTNYFYIIYLLNRVIKLSFLPFPPLPPLFLQRKTLID